MKNLPLVLQDHQDEEVSRFEIDLGLFLNMIGADSQNHIEYFLHLRLRLYIIPYHQCHLYHHLLLLVHSLLPF